MTSNLSLNYSNTENTAYTGNIASSVRNEKRYNLNGNLSYSFTAAKGIKLPFIKKRLTLQNELTTDLSFSVEKTYNTKETTEKTTVEKDYLKYTITPGASYKFSKSITAGLESNYENSFDKQTNIKISSFRLSIWIEIIF